MGDGAGVVIKLGKAFFLFFSVKESMKLHVSGGRRCLWYGNRDTKTEDCCWQENRWRQHRESPFCLKVLELSQYVVP